MLSYFIKKTELNKIDKTLFFTFLSLFLIGIFTFFSASMSILNKGNLKFYNMLESQGYAYILGIILFLIAFLIPYALTYKLAPFVYLAAIILSFMVFLPGFGMSHGGSTRWLNVGGFSLQPGEILKLGSIVITAWYIKRFSSKFYDYRYSILLYGAILSPSVLVMFLQKDLGTLLILGSVSFSIYFTSKLKISHLLTVIISGILVCSVYVYTNDYVKNRIFSYSGTIEDKKGVSYQNDQALIAIGNGDYFGRGFGQSIQKFHYLPEPVGDSIFAVYAEEFGFFGSVILVFLFFFAIIKMLLISIGTKEVFAKAFILGFAMLLFLQTVLNIGSMLKIIPLSGDTLPFFSQGGTALMANMMALGFLLQLTKIKN